MTRPRLQSIWRSPWFAGLVVVAATVAGFSSQRFALGDDASGRSRQVETLAGAWFCAGPDGPTTLVAAAPPAPGGRPAEVTSAPLTSREPAAGDTTPIFPGGAAPLEVLDGLPVTVRWRSWPAVVTEIVRPDDGERTIADPCAGNASSTWIVPGLITADGATAQVTLANPFDSPAAASVTLSGVGGPRDLLRLENVSVEPRSTTTIDLNEVAPAESDLSVYVTTTAGRVVAQGLQRLDQEVGGVAGVSMVRATREAATSWTLPWYEVRDGDSESWAWITNPNDAPTIASIEALTTAGPVDAPEFAELTLAPGETRRFDLRGLQDGAEGGVAVTSDLPVVAASATRWTADDAARTGYDVQLGSAEAGKTWIATGPGGATRSTLAHVVNAGERAAVVSAQLWAGAGIEEPPAWQQVRVPPRSLVTLDIAAETPADQVDAPRTVTVVAEEGEVHVTLQSFDREGVLDPLVNLALSERDWQAPATAARPQLDLGLTRSLDMGVGVAPSETASPADG